MGRSHAEKIYSSLGGDLKSMKAVFEEDTRVKYVALGGNSATFVFRKRRRIRREALEALENFVRSCWERLLEYTSGGEIETTSRVTEKEGVIEIAISPLA